jgi:hypothetical protein
MSSRLSVERFASMAAESLREALVSGDSEIGRHYRLQYWRNEIAWRLAWAETQDAHKIVRVKLGIERDLPTTIPTLLPMLDKLAAGAAIAA